MISSPLIYYNTKGNAYSDVTDLYTVGDSVLLNTDKGCLMAVMEKTTLTKQSPRQYKVTVECNGILQSFSDGDTIAVQQDALRMHWDVIKPDGMGRPRYFVRFSNAGPWQPLSSGDFVLPHFKPDSYRQMYLLARDDVWSSKPLSFFVYVTPLWWQKTAMQKWIGLGLTMLILTLMALVAVITRRVILKRSMIRSHIVELELKAIYAQLNPHFIYNTLTGIISHQQGTTGCRH